MSYARRRALAAHVVRVILRFHGRVLDPPLAGTLTRLLGPVLELDEDVPGYGPRDVDVAYAELRDAILRRRGEVIDDEVAQERANNLAMSAETYGYEE